MHSKTYCPLFWSHQFIDGTGRVKPCCRFATREFSNINDTPINKIFNNDRMELLRQNSLNGVSIPGCQRCYTEEDSGKKSLRQRQIEHKQINDSVNFDNPNIKYLELALSNDCNLACRMCDSRYSHRLYDEEKQFYNKTFSKERHTYTNLNSIYEIIEDVNFIKFTGGEPLIIKAHWDLLEYAVEKDYAKNMVLNYATNGTVWPKQKIVDTWSKFKYIELMVSIDSVVPEENEYQRHYTNHTSVLENFDRYIELSKTELDMEVIVRPTISIFTLYNLPETLEWLSTKNVKFNATHVTYPDFQDVTTLPLDAKNIVAEKFKNFKFKDERAKTQCYYIMNHMLSKDTSNLWDKFISHTDFLDKSRNQNFLDVYPWLVNWYTV